MNRRAIVVCYGYLGDHLFASSIAKKLIEEQQFDSVDYLVGWPQIIPLLELNPYISRIIFNGVTPNPILPDASGYNKVINLGQLSFIEQPCIEFQKVAGVKNPSPDFEVYTHPEIDKMVAEQFKQIKESNNNTPIVAIMDNWQPKTFLFTKEQYELGIDVPNKGYGGSWRDIPSIINKIKEHFITTIVGAPSGVTQFQTSNQLPPSTRSLLEEATVLKHCDFFVGAEGGLANLASGVGCKTILTSDFVHQLYGWNGVIRKIQEPKLGPRYYFPNGHIDLDPYLTDTEVADNIINIIKGSI